MAHLTWLAVVRHGQSTGNVAAEAAETGPSGTRTYPCPTRAASRPPR
jgi:hypothetical protein